MYRLYDFSLSGNCYKVRLLLTQLGIAFERVDVNLLNQETRLPKFLQRNPSGKVPVLEIAPDTFLTESGAILTHFADGTEFYGRDRDERTEILKWLFFEQFSLGANLSRPRFWISVANQADQFTSLIAYHQRLGNAALQVIEHHLREHSFLACSRYTIADIASYAYVHNANEGGYTLDSFPAIQSWCKRVRQQPNHIKISD